MAQAPLCEGSGKRPCNLEMDQHIHTEEHFTFGQCPKCCHWFSTYSSPGFVPRHKNHGCKEENHIGRCRGLQSDPPYGSMYMVVQKEEVTPEMSQTEISSWPPSP